MPEPKPPADRRAIDPTAAFLDHLERSETRNLGARAEQTISFVAALREQTVTITASMDRQTRVGLALGTLLILGVLALAGVQVSQGAEPASLQLGGAEPMPDASSASAAPASNGPALLP